MSRLTQNSLLQMNALPPTAAAPPKPCNICNDTESCITIPSISGSQHLCLLHYFTTGAHRQMKIAAAKDAHLKKKKSLLLDSRTVHQQLPQVKFIGQATIHSIFEFH